MLFSACRYISLFQIFAVKFESCWKSHQILDVSALPNFKFYEATPHGSKVLAANTLNLKPIFDPLSWKTVIETLVPREVCASKTWSFNSMCKNLGAQHPWMSSIPEIFAVKVRSHPKSHQILHVFGLKIFLRRTANFWTCVVKFSLLPSTVQNFTVIDQQNSEMP